MVMADVRLDGQGLSLSDEQLRWKHNLIQQAYEDGHAVSVGCLSFHVSTLWVWASLTMIMNTWVVESYVEHYDQMKLHFG